mgnify:CR=1 FL=1
MGLRGVIRYVVMLRYDCMEKKEIGNGSVRLVRLWCKTVYDEKTSYRVNADAPHVR